MPSITPSDVFDTIAKHMLVDGLRMVFDLERSHGVYAHDSRTGREYLDFFQFFASSPLGHNHPRLREPEFLDRLGRVAVNKPSNSDVYTIEMAECVEAFSRHVVPPELPHLFFISGGSLAVENALKVAFDWKVRKNLARGLGEKGSQVVHFRHAFHGRSGYTLSLTDSFDPRKTKYFPKFDWPRIESPALRFPVTDAGIAEVEEAEARAVAAIERAFDEHPDDIAAILIEPIQGEGGDRHFRKEFFRELRRIADEREAFLIVDEVQTGFGATGRMWAYEHFDFVPDALAFGKKSQVCGIMVGRRVEEVENHVFAEASRINSTWGGNLVDMYRSTRILEILAEENLLLNAACMGSYLVRGLEEMQGRFDGKMTGVRGRGTLVAFDLPDTTLRGHFLSAAFENGLLALPCGERSIRFRPPLNVRAGEIDEALGIVEQTLRQV